MRSPSPSLAYLMSQGRDVRLTCRGCGHVRHALAVDLAVLHGESITLAQIARRSKCLLCDGKASVEQTPHQRPRVGRH